jgi:hypothetical protein
MIQPVFRYLKLFPAKYIKEFEPNLDWGPDNLRWLSNDSFIVDKYILESKEELVGQVIFKYNGTDWIETEK